MVSLGIADILLVISSKSIIITVIFCIYILPYYLLLSLCPFAAAEVEVANGFCDVLLQHPVAGVKVGNGACHLEDTAVGTGYISHWMSIQEDNGQYSV